MKKYNICHAEVLQQNKIQVIGKFHDFQTNSTEIRACRMFLTPRFTISTYSRFKR